jgi:DNA repair protein RadD
MKTLRPYQIQAIEAINYALKRGVKKMAIILPTGAGKTFTAVQAIKDMGRILFLGHTEELLEQSAAVLKAEFGCEIGLIKADVFDIDHKVVMAAD